ncbi:MAG TPA: ABC-type transport auxiliary lipoprotein family protein [Casimicrobiaceae bacterium]
MRKTALRTSALIVVCMFLALAAGCGALTREPLVRQTFLLEPPAPPPLARAQPGALRVGTINVAAPYRGKTFVYRMSDLQFETDFYVEFLVPPAAMLTEQTARALDRAKAFARVAGPGASVDAQWVLDGFASSLYADLREAGKPAAELAITYYLTPAGGSEQTPVWSHEYRQRAPMRDSSPAAYAQALNQAFGEIVAALARDLAGAQLPQR